ncbi:uncharacterized protein TEOVI_000705500 [Trypanosoma equiperdum]|uniref:Transmembrane protein n=3 Tax=Trypanozoon TaxID=39700 RepID=A0A3L6LAX1_9TRYP|nr:hypothetical protein, conserved [Trypanosoma brucei gambiense DAL972]RHW73398.1 hypothetical protein DPX39_030067800 [Trypanosoma brucei equiperdum]SCU64295.1 hypothetical protein, conserved [Trypanosoma equiperdum]RHW73444.1 hypothetical protein DPX39_030052800 [Trypanosoma brucei equiperdum]RHW73464.1 hypothetical protein DPX39_030062800 [Trypanosoma brucei equiperdum]RHW73648.1 hypothetical protein DPX39_030057800 [Trypanosoma brucei equiperdum]|eukprot:XP_011772552.1 hypothetical protein, conserved [Trypanosoma brucei gambiense DAL972]
MPARASQRTPRGTTSKSERQVTNKENPQEQATTVPNDSTRTDIPDVVAEVQKVEAILARRRETMGAGSNGFTCGTWVALVVLEVLAFVWLSWAMDVYAMYRGARP